MNTRPTDEEIRAMADRLRNAANRMGSVLAERDAATMLDAIVSVRQAARDGVTDEMVEKFKADQSNAMSRYTSAENAMGRTPKMQDAMDYGTRAALQSIAQPITSISDALNFLENAALGGWKLEGDDIPSFRALADRIAPVAQPVMVPESLHRKFTSGNSIPVDRAVITRKEYEAMLSTSPHPQQAVPDGEWEGFQYGECPHCGEDLT